MVDKNELSEIDFTLLIALQTGTVSSETQSYKNLVDSGYIETTTTGLAITQKGRQWISDNSEVVASHKADAEWIKTQTGKGKWV